MREYFIQSVVLDKEPLGEMDARVFLYSDSLGKVAAKIRSARKITSKLNSHLEPLDLAKVRLVEKNSFQVADAQKFGRLPDRDFKVLKFVNSVALDNYSDRELWLLLKKGNISIAKVLAILGFDPVFAVCGNCKTRNPEFFHIKNLEYYCGKCVEKNLGKLDFIEVYPCVKKYNSSN